MKNVWPVTLAGEPAPGFTFSNRRGETFILSLTGKMYALDELKKWTPKFRGLPVYESHLEASEMKNGRGDITLTTIDPREYRGERVGFISKTGFSEKYQEVRAMLTVTSDAWQESLVEALFNDSLGEIGLSMTPHIFESTRQLRVAEGVYFPQVEIMEIFSVDLTDQPFLGGRFLGTEPSERWSEYALKWKLRYIEGLK